MNNFFYPNSETAFVAYALQVAHRAIVIEYHFQAYWSHDLGLETLRPQACSLGPAAQERTPISRPLGLGPGTLERKMKAQKCGTGFFGLQNKGFP